MENKSADNLWLPKNLALQAPTSPPPREASLPPRLPEYTTLALAFSKEVMDCPAEYRHMAARNKAEGGDRVWDEAAQPRPRLPSTRSPDADEKRLATRRKVSCWHRGTLVAVRINGWCRVPASLCRTC